MGVTAATLMGIGMAAISVGSATMVFDQNSLVPMGVVVSGFLLVGGLVWHAGRKFQLILSRIERVEDDVSEVKDFLQGKRWPRRPHHTPRYDETNPREI